jgi:ABC-type phosphate/phosphonate transport system ATPase subunit
MDKQDLQTGLSLIRKDFNLDETEFSIHNTELSRETLLQQLKRLVNYLLEKDFGKLLQVLYRIDISEEKLKAALASDEGDPVTLISNMILEREMQKVATRKKYSSL